MVVVYRMLSGTFKSAITGLRWASGNVRAEEKNDYDAMAQRLSVLELLTLLVIFIALMYCALKYL